MENEVKQIIEAIKKYDVIILHRHTFPDGDAIGSQVGMKYLIEENFPDKKVYITGDPAGRYSFVKGCEPQELTDELFFGALSIILDTPDVGMIADNRYEKAASGKGAAFWLEFYYFLPLASLKNMIAQITITTHTR